MTRSSGHQAFTTTTATGHSIRRVISANPCAFVSGIGPTELVIVLVLALLILGPKRLPDAGRAVGRGMREFKDAIAGRVTDEPTKLDR